MSSSPSQNSPEPSGLLRTLFSFWTWILAKLSSFASILRRTRLDHKSNHSQGKVERQKAKAKRNEAPEKENSPAQIVTQAGQLPASSGQDKAGNSRDSKQSSSNIMRPIETIWRGVKWCASFIEAHHGVVTALATVAIVVLTCYYVKYAKKQWETMQRQLEDSEILDAAKLTVADFTPQIDDLGNGMADISGDIVVKNVGPTVAQQINEARGIGDSRVPPAPLTNLKPIPAENGPWIGPGDTRKFHVEFREVDWNGVQNGTWYLSIFEAFSYRDVFGKVEVVPACFMYFRRSKQFGPCPINQGEAGFATYDTPKKK